MSNESDIRAIDELRAMARVYGNHGFHDKAAQLLKLAQAMQARLERTTGVANDAGVVDMKHFRADHSPGNVEEEIGKEAH